MDSEESHFEDSLIVRDKVTRLSTNHNLFEEKAGEPKRNRAEALLLTSLTPYRYVKPVYYIHTHTPPPPLLLLLLVGK